MNDIITTLHPENDKDINLYPNIKKENIPNGSVDESKLSDSVNDTLDGINTRLSNAIASITQPKYYDILSLPTTDVGLIVGSDGYIYSWNGSSYTNTNIEYQATQIADGSVTIDKLGNDVKNAFNYNINKLSKLVELNAESIESNAWYQNGTKHTDAGWKMIKYDVTNIDYVYITGTNKSYRDLLTCFDSENNYVKSIYNNTASDVQYTDYKYDVSDVSYIYLSQYYNTIQVNCKVIYINVGKYLQKDETRKIEYFKVLSGNFLKNIFTSTLTDKAYVYDVSDYETIHITGIINQYQNKYTLLDENNNVLNYDIQLDSSNSVDFDLDVTNYNYIAFCSNSGYARFTINGYINFRNLESKNYELLKWDSTVNYTYQQGNQYTATYVVSNSYDVTNLDKVKIKAKSLAYVNYYTLLKNGAVVGYGYNNSSNVGVDYEHIIDVSNVDTLLVTVDRGHEDRYGYAYILKDKNINNLNDKNIGWFGTSIPAFGQNGLNHPESYPNIVGNILGADVTNLAIGESCVHCKDYTLISETNPYGFNPDFRNCARCLTNSLTEMEWIIEHFNSGVFTQNVPASLSDSDKAFIRSCSYENRLLPYLNTFDIFVFEHGHNDIADTGNHNYETTSAIYGNYNLYSYVSAMNWLVKLIKESNPRAVIIQISEYDYNTNKYGVDKQKKFADIWNIPFMELYKVTGWSSPLTIETDGYWDNDGYWVASGGTSTNKTIRQLYMKDDLHPYSDRSNKTSWYLADLIYSWLISNI